VTIVTPSPREKKITLYYKEYHMDALLANERVCPRSDFSN